MKGILTLCLAFLGIAVLAQSQEEPDSVVMLDELVVSANRIPELRSKVAQQVQVLNTEQIQNLNVQTTADLIINSGAVAMQKSQQGGGSPQIRGFEASRVLLVIDGVRMNNLIYRAGHLQNVITLDNNTLERAEILFGPSSTAYGSDALGGVIHFKTKDPKLSDAGGLDLKANAFFRYGTVNSEKSSHVDINLGGKKFGSFTSFTHSDFGDLKMGRKKNPALDEEFGLRNFYVERSAANTEDVLVTNSDPHEQKFSGYFQVDLVQKFLFRQNERINHTVNIQFSKSSDIPRYDRLTDPEGTGLRQSEWYYGPQKRLMTAYQITIDKLGGIADHFRGTFSYQNVEESRYDRRFNRPNRRNQIEQVDVGGLTIDFQKTLKKHDIRYGFDAQFNGLESTAYNANVMTGARSPEATRYPGGKNTMNYYALYLTHTHDISDKLTLNDGIRVGLSNLYSQFTDNTFFPFPFDEVKQNNSYASGNLGLIYRPVHSWRFFLLASTGYRVPNIDDLAKVFATSAGSSLIVPNPDVKPEKTVNIDLTIARYFGGKLRWENTGFYTTFFDAIVISEFTFNGQSVIDYDGQPTQVLANQNQRKAYIAGFSSLLNGAFSENIFASASFNYTKGRIKTDSADVPLDHIPPSFGRFSLQYRTAKFNSEAFVNFNGWKRLDDYLLNSEDNEVYATPEGMPSWYTVNLRLGYEINKYITLQAGVDNLLDLQYRTFGSGINSPGRNLFFTVRASL